MVTRWCKKQLGQIPHQEKNTNNPKKQEVKQQKIIQENNLFFQIQALIGTNLSDVLWAYAVQLTTPLTVN